VSAGGFDPACVLWTVGVQVAEARRRDGVEVIAEQQFGEARALIASAAAAVAQKSRVTSSMGKRSDQDPIERKGASTGQRRLCRGSAGCMSSGC